MEPTKKVNNKSLGEECDLSDCSDEWEGTSGLVMPQNNTYDVSLSEARNEDCTLPEEFKYYSERLIQAKLLNRVNSENNIGKSILKKCASDSTVGKNLTNGSPEIIPQAGSRISGKSKFSKMVVQF